MILHLPENRIAITKYLNKVNEEAFTDEFVIPFFTSYGYQVYRINDHGGGEHGKDIIFSRYNPIFLDIEYIAVQVKSEKANTSNVSRFADQLKRALKLPFVSRMGTGKVRPNLAVFINSRRHTNDAHEEFLELLIEHSNFIRILSQENVCDLIMNSGIGPTSLISKLSRSTTEEMSDVDKDIHDTLMEADPKSMDKLLDHQLKLVRHKISPRIKEMVIDTIYLRWEKDPSWDGTVKPMKWFEEYFDFFSERQYKYLMDVIKELTSMYPSYKAQPYTISLVQKITPEILATRAKDFVYHCADLAMTVGYRYAYIIFDKLKELSDSGLVIDKSTNKIMNNVLKFRRLRKKKGKEYEKLKTEILRILHPDEGLF